MLRKSVCKRSRADPLNPPCIAKCGAGGGRAAKFSAARPRSPNPRPATNQADRSRKPPAPLAGEPFAARPPPAPHAQVTIRIHPNQNGPANRIPTNDESADAQRKTTRGDHCGELAALGQAADVDEDAGRGQHPRLDRSANHGLLNPSAAHFKSRVLAFERSRAGSARSRPPRMRASKPRSLDRPAEPRVRSTV